MLVHDRTTGILVLAHKADLLKEIEHQLSLGPDDLAEEDQFLLECNFNDIVNLNKHHTAGLELYESLGRVFLRSMKPSTAAAKIPDWRTRLRGAWLIKIGNTIISSVEDASSTLRTLVNLGAQSVTLQFSHPEIRPNLSRNGLPIVSSAPFTQHVHDQLNNRWEFTTVAQHLQSSKPTHQHVDSGGILNVVSRVMKLT
jgi:hypothetical protein